MIGSLLHTIIYLPIYNALVFFVDVLPSHDMGVAVTIVTILVRIILFPIARKAIRSQIAMKAVAPEVEELKKKYKDKPEEQGRAMFALYKERGVNPFSGFLLLFLQIPVLLGLYWHPRLIGPRSHLTALLEAPGRGARVPDRARHL